MDYVIKALLFAFAALTLSGASCRDPLQAVSMKNKTSRSIEVTAIRRNDEGQHTVDFALRPGASTSWDYTVPESRTDQIDPSLEEVLFRIHDECVITVPRRKIQEWSDGSGWEWYVPLTEERMACPKDNGGASP